MRSSGDFETAMFVYLGNYVLKGKCPREDYDIYGVPRLNYIVSDGQHITHARTHARTHAHGTRTVI